MLDFEFLLFVIILKFNQYRDQKALKAKDYNQQNEEERWQLTWRGQDWSVQAENHAKVFHKLAVLGNIKVTIWKIKNSLLSYIISLHIRLNWNIALAVKEQREISNNFLFDI